MSLQQFKRGLTLALIASSTGVAELLDILTSRGRTMPFNIEYLIQTPSTHSSHALCLRALAHQRPPTTLPPRPRADCGILAESPAAKKRCRWLFFGSQRDLDLSDRAGARTFDNSKTGVVECSEFGASLGRKKIKCRVDSQEPSQPRRAGMVKSIAVSR